MKKAVENLKVCLVTWYGSNNYGTNLQAYALYTVLRSKGIYVDMIRPFQGRKSFTNIRDNKGNSVPNVLH